MNSRCLKNHLLKIKEFSRVFQETWHFADVNQYEQLYQHQPWQYVMFSFSSLSFFCFVFRSVRALSPLHLPPLCLNATRMCHHSDSTLHIFFFVFFTCPSTVQHRVVRKTGYTPKCCYAWHRWYMQVPYMTHMGAMLHTTEWVLRRTWHKQASCHTWHE